VDRRKFLNRLATFVHWVIGACAVIPALGFLAVRGGSRRDSGDFVRVVRLDGLAPGIPSRVPINTSRQDAYLTYPPGPIGSVWLVLETNESEVEPPSIRCMQTICPHLGCGVDYSPDRNAFYCPCHASEFALSGAAKFGPSPRPMDSLPCRVTDPDENGVRWVEVEYRTFRTGVTVQVRLT